MSQHPTYLLDRAKIEGAHTLAVAQKHGAYEALRKILKEGITYAQVIQVVKDSGLRGRGGAGFPTGMKWSFMPDPAKDPRPRYLAVNADESEPGTCKDRVLMEQDPHGFIEGCLVAAYAIRAQAVYIYVRGEYRHPYNRVFQALAEARKAGLVGKRILGSDFDCEVWMHKGAGAYICGEETGLMESLEGKRGHPRPKPPFPAMFGLWGQPTTVNNVETVFNAPFIVNRGAAWFQSMGTKTSTGNLLVGVSGHVNRPGVYELPFGVSCREIVEDVCGGVWKGKRLKGFFPGGSSTGVLPASFLDTKLEHDAIKATGSMLGTAAMIVMDEDTCMVRAHEIIARFYEHESCGQCSQCREGTQWLHQIFRRIENGEGRHEDIDMLVTLSQGMAPGKTICALSDAAAIPTLAVVKHFRSEFQEHVEKGACPHLPAGTRRPVLAGHGAAH
ncbi:MAG: NADH-quinone oxidoreductase subunit NuoF [Planctomycetes bacterium]|nr:NADH-quinone oxidoreductase subunit NuoF [Planctomycetota bacterium]